MLVLGAHGLDNRSIHVKSETFLGSFARLEDGSVDALFILTGQPSDPIARAAESEAKILPIAGEAIDRLRQQYPFLQPSLIPGGVYAGHDEPIRTIGMDSLRVADIDRRASTRSPGRGFSPCSRRRTERCPALSAERRRRRRFRCYGAARYYRERQLQP
jgi:hypothetical protein